MTTNDDTAAVQETRRERLQGMADIHHQSRYGDYDDTFSQFAEAYGLKWDDDTDPLACPMCEGPTREYGEGRRCEPCGESFKLPNLETIPRYVSLADDETYGMMSTFEDLGKAINHQCAIPNNGETLNHPAGVYDLDTVDKQGRPVRIEFRMVAYPESMAETMRRAFIDAIDYRMGEADDDTDDPDEQEDLRQAREYGKLRDILKLEDDN